MSNKLTKVTTGTTKEALEAIRDAIVADLENCEAMRDRSALYLRLESVVESLGEHKQPAAQVDPIDEVANARKKRRGVG